MDVPKLKKNAVPISRIAEMLGKDWKGVAKAAKSEHTPGYQREVRASKLDPYKDFIEARLKSRRTRGEESWR